MDPLLSAEQTDRRNQSLFACLRSPEIIAIAPMQPSLVIGPSSDGGGKALRSASRDNHELSASCSSPSPSPRARRGDARALPRSS